MAKKPFFLLMTHAMTALLAAALLLTACAVTEQDPGSKTARPSGSTPPASPGSADAKALLADKTVLFCGDSICMASTYDTEHQWWGWAGRISRDCGLKSYTNAGVDGASVSTCRGTNTISAQIIANKDNSCDIVVLHGGVNDAWDSAPVGNIVDKPASETVLGDLDLKTFAGGLESLFMRAKKYFPDSAIMYVINFKLNSHAGRMCDMTEYWDEARKICDKYDIPFFDLYDNEVFQKEFDSYSPDHLADGIHPNSKGYDILANHIAAFMANVLAER